MISPTAQIGKHVIIREGVVVEDNSVIGDNSFLDYNCIIRSGVNLGAHSYIGPNCILGEHTAKFYKNFLPEDSLLHIGAHALIRSHCVLYRGSVIGDHFQTGHHVTVREGTKAGTHWRLGTLSDIQGDCIIGDYVNMHSNVHIGKAAHIGNYVWIFPYCVLTNDPIPPSNITAGVTIDDYAVVSTGSILLPGVIVGNNSLIGAGSIVTKSVAPETVVFGNPAHYKCHVNQILNPENGFPAYPWIKRFHKYIPNSVIDGGNDGGT